MRFFKRVPPGLRLGDDACIFQRCVPDSRTMKGFNSGRSEEKGKKEAEEEETGAHDSEGSRRRSYRRLCLCWKYNIIHNIIHIF